MLKILFFANTFCWQIGISHGESKLGANVVVTMAIGLILLVQGKIFKKFPLISIPIIAFIGIYSLPIVFIGPCQDEYLRAAISGCVFILFYLVAFEVGRTASNEDWADLQNCAMSALAIGAAMVLLEVTFPELFPNTSGLRSMGKYSGIFSEPSALATALMPSIIILLNASVRRKVIFGIVSVAVLFFVTKTATVIGVMLLYLIYSIFFKWPWRASSKVMIGGLITLFFFTIFGYDEFVDPVANRILGLFLGENTDQVSSMVYIAGIQDATGNFLRTFGLGTGFNTMGCNPMPYSSIRDYLAISNLDGLNARDGSFLLSKLVSEFGLFGFVVVAIIWRNMRSIELISMSKKMENFYIMSSVISSLLLSFLFLSMVRSSGYFHGSIFMAILALGGGFRLMRLQIFKLNRL